MPEFYNKIELSGIIGHVSVSNIGDKQFMRFSVAVKETCKDKNNDTISDVSWFNCTGWNNCLDNPLTSLVHGDNVHLTGKLRNIRYVDADGLDRVASEISVSHIKILSTKNSISTES